MIKLDFIIGSPLKTGVKSKNGQGVPDSRKADEVRLYALRVGLTTKMVRTAHFRSHEVLEATLCILGNYAVLFGITAGFVGI